MLDIQSDVVAPRFRIASVGVTGLRYPIVARDTADGATQRTAADWRMGVALEAERRGTHMSRFVAELQERAAAPMDLDGHYRFAAHLVARLDAPSADISAAFVWFREVRAPVTGLRALLEGRVTFQSVAALASGGAAAPRPHKTLQVTVSAKSLCPCSKAISDRGAHNQRSDIVLSVSYAPDVPADALVGIARLMEIAESSASSPVYPLLKRADEKYLTELAYDNPVFAEDTVRNAAQRLDDLPQVERFSVEAINRESIHAHDCYARIDFEKALR